MSGMTPGETKLHRPTGRAVVLVTFLRRMFPPHQWVVTVVDGGTELVSEPDLGDEHTRDAGSAGGDDGDAVQDKGVRPGMHESNAWPRKIPTPYEAERDHPALWRKVEIMLRGLSEDERALVVGLVADTCRSCLASDAGCQCWNDE